MQYIVPDVIGEPVVAWRTWFVVPEHKTSGALRLQSIVYGDIWEPRVEHEAECRPGTSRVYDSEKSIHVAPDDEHSCGIYAVDTPEQVDAYYRSGGYTARYEWMEIWRVVGTVAMWGKIVPGSNGYRSQYAYPKMIQVPKRIKGRLQHLSATEVVSALEHYDCDVELMNDTLDLTKS
jgi:hypothetical protein